jgi:hypothetical protein
VFRQGHLSESALVDALLTGDRAPHLDRCEICAERAVELGRWLDEVRAIGLDAADAAFPPERLAAQQSQILRRLEQLDEPARVLAFPSQYRHLARESSPRRVAPAWVGVAAAAGLVIGAVGGHWTGTLRPVPVATAPASAQSPDADAPEAGAPRIEPAESILNFDLEDMRVPSLDVVNEITPRMVMARTGR